MKGLNLSQFKKIKSDAKTTTLEHPQGHKIVINHKGLNPRMQQDLHRLPFADGGEVPMAGAPEGDPDAPTPYGAEAMQVPQAAAMPPQVEAIAPEAAPAEAMAEAAPQVEAVPAMAPEAAQAVAPEAAPQPAPQPAAEMQLQQPAPTARRAPEAVPGDTFGVAATDQLTREGYNAQQEGNEMAAAAQKQAAANEQREAHIEQVRQRQNRDDYKSELAQLDADNKSLSQDIKDQHINPDHYMSSLNTSGKLMTIIGLIAGGMGGRGQGNPAMDVLQANINRDIDAQKAELGKRENLLAANMKHYGNLRDSTDMLRVQQLDIAAMRFREAAAKSGDPAAQARLLQAAGALESQAAPILGHTAMRRALLTGVAKGNIDPETMIRVNPYDAPAGQQESALKELKEAQSATALRDNTLSAFDEMAALNTVGGIVGSAGQNILKVRALKGAALDKLTKDVSGRVTPETVKLIGGMFDTLLATPGTVTVQRRELNRLLSQGMNYPALKAFGVDPSTLSSQFNKQGASRFSETPVK